MRKEKSLTNIVEVGYSSKKKKLVSILSLHLQNYFNMDYRLTPRKFLEKRTQEYLRDLIVSKEFLDDHTKKVQAIKFFKLVN